jgi:hypothetical protein
MVALRRGLLSVPVAGVGARTLRNVDEPELGLALAVVAFRGEVGDRFEAVVAGRAAVPLAARCDTPTDDFGRALGLDRPVLRALVVERSEVLLGSVPALVMGRVVRISLGLLAAVALVVSLVLGWPVEDRTLLAGRAL